MSQMKSLWAMVQGDPVFMRRVNGWLAIFWLIMIPISIVTHWVNSVMYVSALSLWALVSGHWSAWQAARVEVRQEEDAKKKDDEDIPAQVVEAIVEATTLSLDGRNATAVPLTRSDFAIGGYPDHRRLRTPSASGFEGASWRPSVTPPVLQD